MPNLKCTRENPLACQQFMPRKRLFDSVLAKNHIFLNEARWARLQNKTPREIMNMDRKTELETLL